MKLLEYYFLLFPEQINPMVWDINKFSKGKFTTFSISHHAGQRHLSLLAMHCFTSELIQIITMYSM